MCLGLIYCLNHQLLVHLFSLLVFFFFILDNVVLNVSVIQNYFQNNDPFFYIQISRIVQYICSPI